MKNVYPSIDYYNAGKKLEVCDDMIADFISNTKRGHFHQKNHTLLFQQTFFFQITLHTIFSSRF